MLKLAIYGATIWGMFLFPGISYARPSETESQLLIVDPRGLPREDFASTGDSVEQLSDVDQLVPLSSVPAAEQRVGDLGTLVDTASIRTDLLFPPGSADRLRHYSHSPPFGITHLRVVIEGKEYILRVVESRADPKYSLRHVTAVVVNRPDSSYARFTVDDKSGDVVGTIKTSSETYRIIPSTLGNTQLVFRLSGSQSRSSDTYTSLSSVIATGPEIQRIEARHIQAEALANFQPTFYTTNDLTVYLHGDPKGNDNLGTVNVALLDTPDEILRLLTRLGPLTGARGGERFKIDKILRHSGRFAGFETEVWFRQVIQGIPVRKRNLLRVASTGHVERLQVTVLDDSWIPPQGSISLSEEMARSIALDAIRQYVGSGSLLTIEPGSSKPELTYDIAPGKVLVPMWRASFIVSDQLSKAGYRVRINMQTGESLVAPARLEYSADVYKPVPPGSGPTAVGPNTALVWEDHGTSYDCVATEGCDQPAYSKPKDFLSELRAIWQQNADICCGAMPAIDVIAQSSATSNGFWDSETSTIVLGPGLSTYPSSVTHEMSHAYLTSYNYDFALEADESSHAMTSDETGIAIIEGLADAIAAVYSELTTYSGDIGTDAWILAEGFLIAEKDLTVPRDWGQLADGNLEYHTRALSVGSFFYRLANTDVVPPERIMRLLLQVSRSIESGTDSLIRMEDLKIALNNATGSGDEALQNAINYMWFEPLLLVGADVAASEDPIEDQSLYNHSVFEGGDFWSVWTMEAADMWGIEFVDGAIFMTSQYGQLADHSYFYVDDEVFQFGSQEETKDFTLEFYLLTWDESGIPRPLVTNNLPLGDPGSWALTYTGDSAGSKVKLRSGSVVLDSGNVWNTGDWVHVALVRAGDRGIVYLDGTAVIDDATIFEDTSFSLPIDSKLSFGGWNYGNIPGWANVDGFWDEIRLSRGARYMAPFAPRPWERFPRLE